MRSTLYYKWILMLALCLFFACIPISLAQPGEEKHPDEQQDDPWIADVTCRGGLEREGRGFINDREFRLCFKFEEKALQPKPGAAAAVNWTYLNVVSYTSRTGKNLSKIDITNEHPAEYPGLIIEKPEAIGPERNFGKLSSIREFKCKIGIQNLARSDQYPIDVAITSGTETAGQKINFHLPILSPAGLPVSVEKEPHASVDCWAGSKCSPLQLHFVNKLPYKVEIVKISVASDDLLQDTPLPDYEKKIDVGSTPHDINLTMQAKPMTLKRTFTGFGKPQVTMRIDFKDEHERPFSSLVNADLEIRPNIVVLAIFVILGAVVGTLVRIDLRRLQRAGIITKRQRLVFAATTFASGILVCLIALFADIKLVVLNDQNSYSAWDPKVLFLTALIATVSGLPILYAFMKLPRQPEPSPQIDEKRGHGAADIEGTSN